MLRRSPLYILDGRMPLSIRSRNSLSLKSASRRFFTRSKLPFFLGIFKNMHDFHCFWYLYFYAWWSIAAICFRCWRALCSLHRLFLVESRWRPWACFCLEEWALSDRFSVFNDAAREASSEWPRLLWAYRGRQGCVTIFLIATMIMSRLKISRRNTHRTHYHVAGTTAGAAADICHWRACWHIYKCHRLHIVINITSGVFAPSYCRLHFI